MTPMVGASIAYALVATIAGPTAALADNLVSSKGVVVGEVALDLDKDGKTDRAVLVRHSASASADLHIYFGAAGEALAASRRPMILKKDIASGAAIAIESRQGGGLAIRYGCGGCSNDTVTELRLIYRNGEVVVGGYTLDWDTRSGIGRCDVDFLTGKGFVGHGLENSGMPFKVRSRPVALSAWSDEVIAKICP